MSKPLFFLTNIVCMLFIRKCAEEINSVEFLSTCITCIHILYEHAYLSCSRCVRRWNIKGCAGSVFYWFQCIIMQQIKFTLRKSTLGSKFRVDLCISCIARLRPSQDHAYRRFRAWRLSSELLEREAFWGHLSRKLEFSRKKVIFWKMRW